MRQLKALAICHHQLTLETASGIQRAMRGQIVRSGGYQQLSPAHLCRCICCLERRNVIRHPVTNRAVIPHINPVHQLAMEIRGHIGNLDRFNAHHAARRPVQIQPEVPVHRLRSPRHVYTCTVARTDNRGHLVNPTIGIHGFNRSELIQPCNMHAASTTGPRGNPC